MNWSWTKCVPLTQSKIRVDWLLWYILFGRLDLSIKPVNLFLSSSVAHLVRTFHKRVNSHVNRYVCLAVPQHWPSLRLFVSTPHFQEQHGSTVTSFPLYPQISHDLTATNGKKGREEILYKHSPHRNSLPKCPLQLPLPLLLPKTWVVQTQLWLLFLLRN